MKGKIKLSIQALSIIVVSPLLIMHLILSRWINEGLFVSSNQFLSLIPGRLGVYLRVAFNRFAMDQCDANIVIGFATLFSQSSTEIEKGVYIGPQCNIGSCRIGQHTLIASGVHIMSGNQQHHTDDLANPIQQQGGVFKKISIGEDCWIGNGCMVMAAVGDKSIIGAGSVVTRDIPPYSIAVGNPARVIRSRLDPGADKSSHHNS
jgi:virginiamycin A acetyltransferase